MATAGSPRAVPHGGRPYEWGSNGLVANNGMVLGAGVRLDPRRPKYRDGAFAAMDYLLGRNPMNYSYVAGYGDQPVRNVHHRLLGEPAGPVAADRAAGRAVGRSEQLRCRTRSRSGCCRVARRSGASSTTSRRTRSTRSRSTGTRRSRGSPNWTAEHSAPPAAAPGCRVEYTASTWQTGLSANVKVTNTGATPWQGWTLAFTFAGAERIQQGWSATWTQQGREATATNVSWNATVAPGASVTLGFNASNSGAHTPPAAFTVNGQSCTV